MFPPVVMRARVLGAPLATQASPGSVRVWHPPTRSRRSRLSRVMSSSPGSAASSAWFARLQDHCGADNGFRVHHPPRPARRSAARSPASSRSRTVTSRPSRPVKIPARRPVPHIQFDGVPCLGQYPGHPLRPRPVRTGMTDEKISPLPAHTPSIPAGAHGRMPLPPEIRPNPTIQPTRLRTG
jgi:hypothetical protein